MGKKILLIIAVCLGSFVLGMAGENLFTPHPRIEKNLSAKAHSIKIVKPPASIPIAACTTGDDQQNDPSQKSSTLGSILSKVNAQTPTLQGQAPGYCLHIPVLMYHHVQPQSDAIKNNQISLSVDNTIFAGQLQYLVSQNYTFVTTDQVVLALQTHTSLPGKPIALTFDDSYLDNYQYVYPLLQKYHVLANFEVPTGLLGIHADTNTYYTWDQLKEMTNSGLVNINPHTWSHYSLGTGAPDKNQYEIATPGQQIKQYIGKTSVAFVYPYGAYQPWIFPILQKYGYIGAFSTQPGMLQCDSFIMHLHRTRIGNQSMASYGL